MANGIRPIQDPFGLSRLADQIRANRQERAMSQTRALQNELLSGRIEQQRIGLADLARERQNQEDLRGALAGAADQDPDRVALEFWQRRDPAKAAQARQFIFSQAGDLARVNPQAAVDFLNTKTGSNIGFAGKQGDLLKLDLGDRLSLYDPVSRQITQTFPKARTGETIETLPDGSVRITRGPVAKKFTETQLKSGGFADRISSANEILEGLEDRPDFDPAGIAETVAGRLPGVGNILLTPERQEYEQAKRNFITANLRLESGAAIAESEFESEDKKFFPQPGDSPGVIKQKREARKRQFDILKAGSAGAFEEIQEQRRQREEKESVIVIKEHPQFGDVTEEDIKETMRRNNLTREQVLQRLGGQ